MSQHLSVNGKQYLQSNELATTFGYSSDYLGKLAREEKILGTQIGRQWFIEPESLKTFLHKTEIQKKIRKEELSIQRKAEHLAHQENSTEKLESIALSTTAFAQALMIIVCGGLVGALGWAGAEAGLTPADLTSGVTQSVALISQSVVPQKNSLAIETVTAVTVANAPVSAEPVALVEELIFTDLPQFGEREIGTTSPASEIPEADLSTDHVQLQFSDEVRVVVGSEGERLVLPVFRDEEVNKEQYLVVPVNNPSEN